jgi:signal peptidase II
MDTSAAAPSGEGKAGADHPVGTSRRHVLLLAALASGVLIADLITKLIVVAQLRPGTSVRALGGLLYFSLYRNAGAAFSMATGMTWVLTLLVMAVVVAIVRMATRLRSTAWAICLGLVLGGALGNLIDRLFRAPGFLRGHVVDFISVFGPDGKYFAIFNVADSAITCGGIALVITALLGVDFDGRRVRTRSGRGSRAGPVDSRR